MTPEVPSFPKKLPIVAFATLLTLMLSVGGIIASALLAESGRAAKDRDGEPTDDRRRREPVLDRPSFAFPEATPAARWSEPSDAAAALARGSRRADGPPVRRRLRSRAARRAHRRGAPRPGGAARSAGPGRGDRGPARGRGAARGPDPRPRSRGKPSRRRPEPAEGRRGAARLLDLVAGEAAFLDVIQARRDSGQHRIEAGLQPGTVLFDEPEALALTFEAMAEAYDWVLCRLHAAPGAVDLLELVAGFMDSVVIASNADAEDPALADLYALAEEAGAGQILVAQDRPAASEVQDARAELRLNAA
ncbi:hypothetical protein ACU4GA_18735 [Methylobacterium oryzae CBMB20]